MKIAVVGSREFKDKQFVENMMIEIIRFDHWTLISGGAVGVDTWAEQYAKLMGWKRIILKANWNDLSFPDAIIKTNKYGKKYDARAGIRRNQLIVDEADKVVAFWDGKSSGTKSTIDMAIKANKPVDIYVR